MPTVLARWWAALALALHAGAGGSAPWVDLAALSAEDELLPGLFRSLGLLPELFRSLGLARPEGDDETALAALPSPSTP